MVIGAVDADREQRLPEQRLREDRVVARVDDRSAVRRHLRGVRSARPPGALVDRPLPAAARVEDFEGGLLALGLDAELPDATLSERGDEPAVGRPCRTARVAAAAAAAEVDPARRAAVRVDGPDRARLALVVGGRRAVLIGDQSAVRRPVGDVVAPAGVGVGDLLFRGPVGAHGEDGAFGLGVVEPAAERDAPLRQPGCRRGRLGGGRRGAVVRAAAGGERGRHDEHGERAGHPCVQPCVTHRLPLRSRSVSGGGGPSEGYPTCKAGAVTADRARAAGSAHHATPYEISAALR